MAEDQEQDDASNTGARTEQFRQLPIPLENLNIDHFAGEKTNSSEIFCRTAILKTRRVFGNSAMWHNALLV
jgi:hypothetical protein